MKDNPALPGGSSKSKPTWGTSKKRSPRRFFSLSVARAGRQQRGGCRWITPLRSSRRAHAKAGLRRRALMENTSHCWLAGRVRPVAPQGRPSGRGRGCGLRPGGRGGRASGSLLPRREVHPCRGGDVAGRAGLCAPASRPDLRRDRACDFDAAPAAPVGRVRPGRRSDLLAHGGQAAWGSAGTHRPRAAVCWSHAAGGESGRPDQGCQCALDWGKGAWTASSLNGNGSVRDYRLPVACAW